MAQHMKDVSKIVLQKQQQLYFSVNIKLYRKIKELKKRVAERIRSLSIEKLHDIVMILIKSKAVSAKEMENMEVDLDLLDTQTLNELAIVVGINPFIQ